MCRLGVFPDAHFQSGQTPATGLVRPRLAGKHQRTHKPTQKARLARVARCEKVAKGLLKGWQCPRPADRCASGATPLDRRPGSMPWVDALGRCVGSMCWVDVLRCPIFRFGLVKSSRDPDRATEWAAGDRFTGQTVESTKRYCNCDTLAQVVRRSDCRAKAMGGFCPHGIFKTGNTGGSQWFPRIVRPRRTGTLQSTTLAKAACKMGAALPQKFWEGTSGLALCSMGRTSLRMRVKSQCRLVDAWGFYDCCAES